jgi:hypothetical protein
MQRFTFTVLARGTGLALPDAFVTVYLTGTTDLAELFEENDVNSERLPNPLITNAFGEIAAYVPNGRYDLRIDHASQPSRTVPDVQIFDANELGIALGPLGLLAGGANQLPFFAGPNIASVTPFTALARELVEIATLPALRDFLEIPGSNEDFYNVPFGFAATPEDDEVLLLHVFTVDVQFETDWDGAQSFVGTLPADTVVLDVQRNGTSVGSITIDDAGDVTFETVAARPIFVIGDVMTIVAPSPADGDIANCAFTFRGAIERDVAP